MIPKPAGRRLWAPRRRRAGEDGRPGAEAGPEQGPVPARAAAPPDAPPVARGTAETPAGAPRPDVSGAGRAPATGREMEAQWLRAAADGDPSAVRWLLDEVAPVVYGFVFARVGGAQAAAEDLLQETLLEAVRSARNFRGDAAASTWMCAIARRRLARYYESERRAELARQSLRLVRGGAAAGDEDEVGDIVDRQDEVVRALGSLPALQRQVLVLKYLEGMAVSEIAVQVNRSRVQVQSLLQRGRDGLRRQLGGRGA